MDPAPRCFDCFRPQDACYCAAIPRIENRTEVLIVQHRRERFHRFNTARMTAKALANSQLLVGRPPELAAAMRLKPRAGVLFPGPTALPLEELTPEERPEQLVILDGTWHHAKTMVRDIPALGSLPRYSLSPTSPSRYRIRREPTATALSTVEAVVAALRILEPETAGLERLLAAFDTMVETQLGHPGSADGERFRIRAARTWKNIPLALVANLENIVVAYGECPPGERGRRRREDGPPLTWAAQRSGDGAVFSCLLQSAQPLEDAFLKHLALPREAFLAGVSLPEARRQWAAFRRPTDMVAVFQPGTARLLATLGCDRDACLLLKSITLESISEETSLEGVLAAEGIFVPPSSIAGRTGTRLAGAAALVRHLNALALQWLRLSEAERPA